MVSWYLNVASAIMSLLQIISKRAFFWLIKYCYLNVILSINKGWLSIHMTGISKKSVQASYNTGTVIPDSMITNLNKGILKLKLLWLPYIPQLEHCYPTDHLIHSCKELWFNCCSVGMPSQSIAPISKQASYIDNHMMASHELLTLKLMFIMGA